MEIRDLITNGDRIRKTEPQHTTHTRSHITMHGWHRSIGRTMAIAIAASRTTTENRRKKRPDETPTTHNKIV